MELLIQLKLVLDLLIQGVLQDLEIFMPMVETEETVLTVRTVEMVDLQEAEEVLVLVGQLLLQHLYIHG